MILPPTLATTLSMEARFWDRMTLLMIGLCVIPCLVATLVAGCENRDHRRATAAAVAEARASAVARTLAASIDDATREQARQKLALEVIEQRLAVQRENFDDYKDLTVHGLTIVGGLIALIGFVFPVAVYLTSILPSQKAVDDVRLATANLDERFAAWTAEQERTFVDRMIEQLESGLAHEQQQAYTNLSLRQHVEFTKAQVVAMGEAARASSDFSLRATVLGLISSYNFPYVSRLMITVLDGKDSITLLYQVVRHCARDGTDDVRDRVREWAVQHPDYLPLIITSALQTAPAFLKTLLNDTAWFARFDAKHRLAAITTAKSSAAAFGQTAAVEAMAVVREFAPER